MRLINLNNRTKGWLIGSLFILCVNLMVFIFQKRFDIYIVLLVVLLTPIAWTALYVLSRLFSKKAPKA